MLATWRDPAVRAKSCLPCRIAFFWLSEKGEDPIRRAELFVPPWFIQDIEIVDQGGFGEVNVQV